MFSIILLLATIACGIFLSPWFFIGTAVVGIYVILRFSYYSGKPWKRIFFPIKKTYITINAQTAATTPDFTKSYLNYRNFLKKFYAAIFNDLPVTVIEKRFIEIEEKINNVSDSSDFFPILKRRFKGVDDSKIEQLLEKLKEDITHDDNSMAMLRYYVFGDIIGRKSNNQNRLEFILAAIIEPKSVNI